MRFDVVTLFPELFAPFLTSGITRRAYESAQVDVHLTNPRDFATGTYRRIDDRAFGGGPGMVMMAEPLAQSLTHIQSQRLEKVPVVLFSPIGQVLDHRVVSAFASGPGAVLLCGRYEGLDQRFIDAHVDLQVSLGDFVLSGGEIAAMALLDCPHYTRPEEWAGVSVPEVLLSGHHLNIERWRREQRLALTARHRPDLLERARAAGALSQQDEAFLAKRI
jgi:tRNA (guanine37-N1)-methyltransferase